MIIARDRCGICGRGEKPFHYHEWGYKEPDDTGVHLCEPCHFSVHDGQRVREMGYKAERLNDELGYDYQDWRDLCIFYAHKRWLETLYLFHEPLFFYVMGTAKGEDNLAYLNEILVRQLNIPRKLWGRSFKRLAYALAQFKIYLEEGKDPFEAEREGNAETLDDWAFLADIGFFKDSWGKSVD